MFPRYQGKESDLDTARKGWNETLPPRLDRLEKLLDGRALFVGDRLSIADIAIGAQMVQLDLVAGMPDAARWPSLVKHAETMKAHPGFVENLAVSNKMIGKFLPEKIDLSR
jgi:glutathione S-transferase